MLIENVQLHNVAQTRYDSARKGYLLQRVPQHVRSALNETAQMRMLEPVNVEIRFVGDGPCRLTLSSENNTEVVVFHGLFARRCRYVIGKKPITIEMAYPENLRKLDERYVEKMAFHPRVTRVLFGSVYRDPVYLHGAEAESLRKPVASELPDKKIIAYGTSITQGAEASTQYLNYISIAARKLNADVYNLGVGGSAYCEPPLADYIAEREDWDCALLSLSVNMQHFTIDEFSRRVSYMVHTIAGTNPDKPVVCVTLFPYHRDFGIGHENQALGGVPEDFRNALREAVRTYPGNNVHLLEGPDLLRNIEGLTSDLLHPGDYGMIEMGENLARLLAPVMNRS